jgi:hypothetical protein
MRDDGYNLVIRKGLIVHYGPATDAEVCAMCEQLLAHKAPTYKPAPVVVAQYWTAMTAACSQPARWLLAGQVPLYAKLTAATPPPQKMRLFQLLWVMPLVPLSTAEQGRLIEQLLADENPPAADVLRQLPRNNVYPDLVLLEAGFPVLA